MANDLATLNGYLDTALNDASDVTWGSTEKNNVITWAVANLWPRISFPNDPTTDDITLVAETYFYDVPDTVGAVSKLFLVDADADEAGFLTPGTWELIGVPFSTQEVHISPSIVDANAGGSVRIYGYSRYDTTSSLIPDDYVPIVLAEARAELYRRVTGDRARFKAWLSRQQTQNVSENEALSMVADAVREAERLRSRQKTWQRPVPARV